ncbi:hypothetical protein P153DRAFT_302027, partial [Dothidotthia symphoricarpi CBS 119687]
LRKPNYNSTRSLCDPNLTWTFLRKPNYNSTRSPCDPDPTPTYRWVLRTHLPAYTQVNKVKYNINLVL